MIPKFLKRFAGKTNTHPEYDDDCLVDYEPIHEKRALSKEALAKQLEKCKQKINTIKRPYPMVENDEHYQLEYTEKGKIKRPVYYDPSKDTVYHIPVTIEAIRSIILKQHCHITKPEEIAWFEDGLKWLSMQQYQNNSSNQYRYFIEEEKHYSGWDEKKQMEIEDFERACEAYFGIPLGLCQDSWAAEFLLTQASRGKILRRVALKSSLKKVSFSLKKLWCCSI
ncbi:uncharacterized protein B0P05DRAFT_557073 [Gilbertella persicaria]|uniref:Uncharacterized protein n=1 Tax=Rhizopus stolonifer TaxID=4846 RepID=A0A367KE66_RHIST|nr:uncharacterized protein B0P05DRAFT_557073 [Gilbertella persicaria]KAI8061875.1 hypothetical protein B0P05DRAFT_557073 [Gilbertella persicaria]RCI00467.1 hypothetical protein CU098_011087 [Rhizopus stolonifer]